MIFKKMIEEEITSEQLDELLHQKPVERSVLWSPLMGEFSNLMKFLVEMGLKFPKPVHNSLTNAIIQNCIELVEYVPTLVKKGGDLTYIEERFDKLSLLLRLSEDLKYISPGLFSEYIKVRHRLFNKIRDTRDQLK